MVELAKWYNLNLRKWREENGFITPEWESYKEAMTIQDIIFTVVLTISAFIIGYSI